MPTNNKKDTYNDQICNYEAYDIKNTFYPGNSKPHFSGFCSNVDNESKLRNQFFALQKADQSQWFPSTNSDLYNNYKDDYIKINFSNYNNQETNSNNINNSIVNNLGKNYFNNNTRVQLKNLK